MVVWKKIDQFVAVNWPTLHVTRVHVVMAFMFPLYAATIPFSFFWARTDALSDHRLIFPFVLLFMVLSSAGWMIRRGSQHRLLPIVGGLGRAHWIWLDSLSILLMVGFAWFFVHTLDWQLRSVAPHALTDWHALFEDELDRLTVLSGGIWGDDDQSDAFFERHYVYDENRINVYLQQNIRIVAHSLLREVAAHRFQERASLLDDVLAKIKTGLEVTRWDWPPPLATEKDVEEIIDVLGENFGGKPIIHDSNSISRDVVAAVATNLNKLQPSAEKTRCQQLLFGREGEDLQDAGTYLHVGLPGAEDFYLKWFAMPMVGEYMHSIPAKLRSFAIGDGLSLLNGMRQDRNHFQSQFDEDAWPSPSNDDVVEVLVRYCPRSVLQPYDDQSIAREGVALASKNLATFKRAHEPQGCHLYTFHWVLFGAGLGLAVVLSIAAIPAVRLTALFSAVGWIAFCTLAVAIFLLGGADFANELLPRIIVVVLLAVTVTVGVFGIYKRRKTLATRIAFIAALQMLPMVPSIATRPVAYYDGIEETAVRGMGLNDFNSLLLLCAIVLLVPLVQLPINRLHAIPE